MSNMIHGKFRNIAVLLLLGGLFLQFPRAMAANDPQVTGPVAVGPITEAGHHRRFLYHVHFGMNAMPLFGLLASAHLTQHQRQQIGRVMRRNGFRSMRIFRRLRMIRERIADKLLAPGKLSQADLIPLERRAEQLQAKMGRNMMQTAISIRNILTPSQLAHVATTHRKLRALRKQIERLLGPGPSAAMMDSPR